MRILGSFETMFLLWLGKFLLFIYLCNLPSSLIVFLAFLALPSMCYFIIINQTVLQLMALSLAIVTSLSYLSFDHVTLMDKVTLISTSLACR